MPVKWIVVTIHEPFPVNFAHVAYTAKFRIWTCSLPAERC